MGKDKNEVDERRVENNQQVWIWRKEGALVTIIDMAERKKNNKITFIFERVMRKLREERGGVGHHR
jgi:hypothetical protein